MLVSNEIVSALDWSPTLLAAAGVPDVRERLLKGYQARPKKFKVPQDGYNQMPYLTGQEPRGARTDFIYFDDDGDVVAVRYENLNRSRCCACQKSSICAPIPTSVRTSLRIRITTG